MTISNYLLCAVAGLLGILFHIFVIKLPALKTAAAAANHPFKVKDYFIADWLTIMGSVLAVLISVFLTDEFITYAPVAQPYLKFVFLFVGYTGSSILQAILNKTGEAINRVVDQKTNELQAIKGSD